MTAYFSQLERLIALGNPGVATKGRTIAYVHPTRRERAVVLLHGYSTKLARTIQLPSTSPLSRMPPKLRSTTTPSDGSTKVGTASVPWPSS